MEYFADNDPTPVEKLIEDDKPLFPWWSNIIIICVLFIFALSVAFYKRNKKAYIYFIFLCVLYLSLGLMFGYGMEVAKNKDLIKMPALAYGFTHAALLSLTLFIAFFKKKVKQN